MPAKKKDLANSGISPVVGREQILGKYWELANLDPEVTKGSIAGQLKALDSLREELDLIALARESERTTGAQDIYRSAWMGQSQ